MTLESIERNYGCVAEYYRSQQDDYEHECELASQWHEYYKANKEKMNKAKENGSFVSYAWDCENCPYYTSIGMLDEYDDIEHGICGNLECTDCTYKLKERMSEIKFDEVFENIETTRYYFMGPKELLKLFVPNKEFPEAISTEILIEFPTINIDTRYASVSVSPTREVENGTEDYDWYDCILDNDYVDWLMRLTRENNDDWLEDNDENE